VNDPLWYIEFRSFASWDHHSPLMYIPVQQAYLRGKTADDAKAELMATATPGGHIRIEVCELAPQWLQKTEPA
jgi:hypothetical protein